MAEIIINTRADHPKYEDGDILDVRQDKVISMCQAEMICHRKKFDNNVQGYNVPGTLAEKYYEKTHEFKFERIGDEVKRTRLSDGSFVMIGSTPKMIDGKMQSMDVAEYIKRRVKHPNHKIFGSVNNEVWYGGKVKADNIDDLWNDIEAKTDKRKRDHDFFPYSERERSAFLAIPVADFDDKEVERMTEPLYEVDEVTGDFKLDEDGNKIVEKARRMQFKWREKLSDLRLSEADVLDSRKKIDLRSATKIDPTLNRERKKNAKERRDLR